MDAAMQTDYPSVHLFPKSGQKLTFTVNGKERFARGEMGEPAVILLNGEPANLHTPIKENDIVKVTESTGGAPGRAYLEKLPEYKSQMDIIVNGARVTLPKYPVVNGELITGSYEIQEGDAVEFLDYVTVEQIKTFMDIPDHSGNVWMVNNKEASADAKVYENFEVIWKLVNRPQQTVTPVVSSSASTPKMAMVAPVIEESYIGDYEKEDEIVEETVQSVSAQMEESVTPQTLAQPVESVVQPIESVAQTTTQTVQIQPTEQAEVPKTEEKTVESNRTEKPSDNPLAEVTVEEPTEPRNVYVVVNGKSVTMTGKPKYVFVDVFNFIEFDLSKPQGAIVTQVNGHDANYMEELQSGDVIQIYWRKI